MNNKICVSCLIQVTAIFQCIITKFLSQKAHTRRSSSSKAGLSLSKILFSPNKQGITLRMIVPPYP
jgi:hypothetical protein